MKKALSILMSVLIIALSFTFVASAACDCKEHKDAPVNSCSCCIECDNIDTHALASCVKTVKVGDKYVIDESVPACCIYCTGFTTCTCACDCCVGDKDGNAAPDQIFDENQQETIIETFQKVLGRVREFFDKFFDAIFEFLRFDQIMGDNN